MAERTPKECDPFRSAEQAIRHAAHTLAGRQAPSNDEIDRAHVALVASGKHSETEMWPINDIEVVRVARQRLGVEGAKEDTRRSPIESATPTRLRPAPSWSI